MFTLGFFCFTSMFVTGDLVDPITIQADSRNVVLRVMDPNPESGEQENEPWKLQIIFPGTKWCGDGNVSGHDEDYGYYKESDKCCKDHDYCPDSMSGGETKHGLHNDAFYTRLHCDCDLQFYDCLKETNSYVSAKIGFTYFNVLGTKCYRNDYPIIGCANYSTIFKRRCKIYELDESQPPIWQWFDLPMY